MVIGRKPSARQVEALTAVAAGRVQYGDAHPTVTRRRHARHAGKPMRDMHGRWIEQPTALHTYIMPTWLLDGSEVYGGQHGTYGSLDERGWLTISYDSLDATPDLRVPVMLSDTGRTALDAL